MAFPPLGNPDHAVVSVSIDFLSNSQQDALLHHIAYDYSRADWDGLHDLLKLGASAAASEFCEWVQVGIDLYIPQKISGQATLISMVSAACAAAIAHRNHFFHLYQKDKSSASKVKFKEASNCCKRVLEAAKLAYVNKTKECITSQKLGSCGFW